MWQLGKNGRSIPVPGWRVLGVVWEAARKRRQLHAARATGFLASLPWFLPRLQFLGKPTAGSLVV